MPPDVRKGRDIPYEELAADMFPESALQGQKFVPFLGAGVSISGRAFKPPPSLKPPLPKREEIDHALSSLNLTGKARTFAQMAILLAYLVQMVEQDGPPESSNAFLDRLKKEEFPPSAGELAELFSQRSHYSTFLRVNEGLRSLFPADLFTADEEAQLQMLQLLARVTRIANPPEALTSIASYFERLRGRKDLWELLQQVIGPKNIPTRTHRLLAEAAKFQLNQKGRRDFLIITTNYDTLMEKALDDLKVPYIVITTKKVDSKVLIRCSDQVEDGDGLKRDLSNDKFPEQFTLEKTQRVVIIYKIHGCLHPDFGFDDEGLVVSDNDYVDYVSRMGSMGMIPSPVSNLMREKRLWFLGYSLSDWNVRSIYETVKKKSDPDRKNRDYSVMYSVGDCEGLFFEKNDITIFQASLNDFVDGILLGLPSRIQIGPV